MVGAIAVALIVCAVLWQKLANIQQALARQSAESTAVSLEAKVLAKTAQDAVREALGRQTVLEAKVSEASLQRSQLEDLMQSLSRSRDENLLVDIDAAVRLAQQQAVLTGSTEPLLLALKSAESRLARAAQPRLNAVQRAVAKDLDRLKAAAYTDLPGALIKLDELIRTVDDLPLQNAVAHSLGQRSAPSVAKASSSPQSTPMLLAWWQASWQAVRQQATGLLRLSRIDTPEAALVAPEQAWFLRENLKLKLLNARLGVLARQFDASRADLAACSASVTKFFDGKDRRTVLAQAALVQLQVQLRSTELPRLDATLGALSTATSGR